METQIGQPTLLGRPTQIIETEAEWHDLLAKTVFAPRASKSNPHCARVKPCASGCQYPQPCDEQTMQPPRP